MNYVKMLEVGDILEVSNVFTKVRHKITRVTKTLAMSKRADGYEQKFKREISSNMSHPHVRHNTMNSYKVIK